MLDFFRHILSTEFMPHGMCFLWDPVVLWINVISDAVVAAFYYAIPFLLFYFAAKRRDITFRWIFLAFGMFILACGTTHLMGVVTVWHPVYRLDGVIKTVTAIASMATFAGLIPMMPTLISLPSPAVLAREIAVRREAEERNRKINEELEERVARRTASLEQALTDLRAEMVRREELESQLIQAQKMEAVGRLAGGVAHDFNNLLTVILGYDEILREHVRTDPLALDYAEQILRASQRAIELTNQLLSFSRRQSAAPRIVDLNEVVLNVDKMLRRMIGEDVALETRLQPDLARVRVDASHIDQVILNLAVNSRDAMPGGGKLTIETANLEITEEYAAGHIGVAPGLYVMLSVSDTGVGMDADTLERIFEPFFTTKEKGKGTGLGLSIVYGIVKQNGGEVRAYSAPGQGTALKIYLPAASGEAETEAPAEANEAEAPATAKILLVEDDEQVRGLTRTMLARRGYRILDAATPEEALSIARAPGEKIDLLLTDIVMPLMQGTELAAEVRGMQPAIRVLYMSGYSDTAVVKLALLSAETAFIQKPFSARDLEKKVREVLGR
jgi:signal transduction histidine kinase/CheY-like chemotaxis protein